MKGLGLLANPELLLILVVVGIVGIIVLGIMGILVALFIEAFLPFIFIVVAVLLVLGKTPVPTPWNYVGALICAGAVYYLLFM